VTYHLMNETLARMHREELMREAEQYRLISMLKERRSSNLIKIAATILGKLKQTPSKAQARSSSHGVGVAEC